MSDVVVIEANLNNPDHQNDIIEMTQAYARDVMGNDGPLPDTIISKLIDGLQKHPTTFIFLAYKDGQAAGIATCFVGFSTFNACQLINIHDLSVVTEFRGLGIGRLLLDAVEKAAKTRGYVKLTLEVQENNSRARHVYETSGFSQAVYGETTGGSLFYSKKL